MEIENTKFKFISEFDVEKNNEESKGLMFQNKNIESESRGKRQNKEKTENLKEDSKNHRNFTDTLIDMNMNENYHTNGSINDNSNANNISNNSKGNSDSDSKNDINNNNKSNFGPNIDANNYINKNEEIEIWTRITPSVDYVKLVIFRGKVVGALLVGDTGLEEVFENLILNQMDVSHVGIDLLDPSLDLEDYFD